MLEVAFSCLDSPEEGPTGTVTVPRDASLLDLRKAIAAAAGLLVEDPPAPDDKEEGKGEKEEKGDSKLPPPKPGDITTPPLPDPPAAHGRMPAWRPKVLDFGLGIVDAAGRQFFSYAADEGAKEAGGLAQVLGIDVIATAAASASSCRVFLIRFGAEARGADLSKELAGRGTQGRLKIFAAAPAWMPPQCPQQSHRGMAVFLSTLYVVTERLSAKAGAEAAMRGAKLVSTFERMMGCPLAALALRTLLDRKAIASLEKGALAAAMYRLIKRLVAILAPADPARQDERAFEHTRTLLYYLMAVAPQQEEKDEGAGAAAAAAVGAFQSVPLECSLMYEQDGQIYERAAILRYIKEQQHGTFRGYRPGPFDSPVGRGARTIHADVEKLRADDGMRRRVEAFLREVYPAMILPPPDTAEEERGMDAAAALALAGAAEAEAWTLTVESDFLPPKRLEGLSPHATLGAFLARTKEQLGLPSALPLTRLRLTLRFQTFGPTNDGDTKALRAPLRSLRGLASGATVKLLVPRPARMALNALPLVMHLGERVSTDQVRALSPLDRQTHEKLMQPPRYSFIVRGDVSVARVLRHLRNEDELKCPGYSIRDLTLWYNWTYAGDGTFSGYYIRPENSLSEAATAMRGRRVLLEVSSIPRGKTPRELKKKKKASRPVRPWSVCTPCVAFSPPTMMLIHLIYPHPLHTNTPCTGGEAPVRGLREPR